MSGWWYVSSGARNGPVSTGEIKRLIATGALGPNTLVWTQGMESWTPAETVPALASMSPPPFVDPFPSKTPQTARPVGTGGMFGMLDYRAHKLLWLFRTPVRLMGWVAYFALIAAAIAIAIAKSTGYALLIQILIGYVAFEVMGLLALIVLWILDWIIQRVFFFVVDVVPARGETVEEAKQIALNGDLVWLSKRLDTNIANWTGEDTERLVSLLNWRARWF